MKKILVLFFVFVFLLGGAYVAGYWPQHTRLGAIEAERAQLLQRAEAAEARVRVGGLLGELLVLKEVVQDMNYGQARGLSSAFFDHARLESSRTTDPAIKQALEAILGPRDAITAALTQGDPAAVGHLREAERRLRAALGWPAPATAAATPIPPAFASPAPLGSPAPAPSPALPSPGILGTPSPGPLGLPSPAASPTPPGR